MIAAICTNALVGCKIIFFLFYCTKIYVRCTGPTTESGPAAITGVPQQRIEPPQLLSKWQAARYADADVGLVGWKGLSSRISSLQSQAQRAPCVPYVLEIITQK